MTPDTINVLVCANAGFFQHLAVMLTSLLATNPGQAFNIVLATGGAPSAEEDKLHKTMAQFPTARFSAIRFRPGQDLGLYTYGRYTTDIYTRLWIADFFGPDVDKVLYLDADMVVVGDIAELWAEDLGDNLLGAVDIPGSARVSQLGLPPSAGYFNSGMLLVNLDKWRKCHALDRVLDALRAHGSALNDPDQDALNICFHDSRKKLDYKWNVLMAFFYPYHDLQLPPAKIEAIKREGRIIHFNGTIRPWSYYSRHPHKATYYRHLARTEWRGYVPPDKTLKDMVQKHVWPLLPKPARNLLRPLLKR